MSHLHDIGAHMLRRLDPETAHGVALWGLRHGLGPRAPATDDPRLATHLWGRDFANPIGIAAGFDKNAVAIEGALATGAGFLEVGGVTPLPQRGNQRPRLFRLDEDGAVINRMGFNNDGMHAVAERLAVERPRDRIIGVNLATNTDSKDPVADFRSLVDLFADLADFLTVDISCPNTSDGQVFLNPDRLAALLQALVALRGTRAAAILVKLSPDTDDALTARLVDVCLRAGIDGLIATNTSRARPPSLGSRWRGEPGGLSGQPLFERSTEVLRLAYRVCEGRLPLIGVGGVGSGDDAYAKIRAGASLVQLYTALVFEGPGLIGRIKRDLAARLAADGFNSVAEAVGADHR